MHEDIVVYTRPLLATHELQRRVFAADTSANDVNIHRKSQNRDYIGRYCLVDWLDDRAVIDCSLIHQWD